MNESLFKGKWKELKGEIQTQWGKLTADDLDQTKGNLKSIAGLIEQKYGHAKEEISTKLHALADRFGGEAEQKVADVKAAAAVKTEDVKETLRDAKRDPSAH